MSFTPAQQARLADRYELLEELDSGAFSDVWVARDHQKSREVVVKISHTRRHDSSVIENQFQREWEALEVIAEAGGHPSIMGLIDHGRTDDHWYSVVEYVTGTPTYDYIDENGPITDAELLRKIGIQLGEAFGFLHKHGIVYRDLKPDNVLLDEDLSPTLIDFNTACLIDSGQTFDTNFKGPFKAPEIAGGDGELGGWTDVYALGKFLFYLLTADAQPADGINPFDFGISTASYLAAVIERATASTPTDRYRNARMFTHALEYRESNPPDRLTLRGVHDDRVLTVAAGETIGRADRYADVQIEDTQRYISGVHAKFDTNDAGKWVIEDLSLNGTWVSNSGGDEFEHRLISDEGKQRLATAETDITGLTDLPDRLVIEDGDIIALVDPEYEQWFTVTLDT